MPAPSNPYVDPTPWNTVKVGGQLVKPVLRKIEGVEIEDEYNVQRPIGKSYAVAVFTGTKLTESIKLTLYALTSDEFDGLRDLWDLLAPKPGSLGGTASPAKSFTIGETKNQQDNGDLLDQVKNTIDAAKDAIKDIGKGGGDGWPKASTGAPNPGPKPPTLSIENAHLAWIGVTAISRKKWEGPYWDEDKGAWYVDLTVIQARPPAPANVGAQGPAKGDGYTIGATKDQPDAASQAGAAKGKAMESPV